MDSIQIYRGNTVIHEFIPDSTFSQEWGLMNDNYIKFSLKAKENISLQYGDYIRLKEEKFTLFSTVHITEAEGIKEYPLTFYGEQYFANRCIVEDEGATTFSYFGGVSDHMALVKLALDKYGLSRFTLGTIEENGSQLIEYDNTKGLDAISKICEAFHMEWEFAGNRIHIKKRVGVDTSYRFEYGKGKGAYSVGLQPIQNTSIATRLIVKGGTTNLPHDYSSIDTPKRLNLGKEVLERNTDKYGIIPEVMINEEIYPRLIGKKVVATEIPADIENATTWKLKLDIPFDLAAQYAPDEKPEVKFQTGDLAGNSFEIVKNSWNNTDKTLQIIVLDQDGYKLPSQNRQPKAGDEFVLLNILMPHDPYITDATKELRKWGEEQLKIVSEPQFAPSLTASPQYIKANNIQLHPGDGIIVVAGGNEIHIRIQKITLSLSHEDRINFELGNNTMYSYEQKITNDLNDITHEVQNIKRKVQNVDRRGWRDAKETNARLEGIEESAALIGTEGGQLAFTGTFQANVNSNPNFFLTTGGQLQHFLYKDTPAKGIWNIGSFNITLQEDVLYSIYAKCDKERSKGIIYISKEKIDIEAEEGYYYFFLGTISSIFEQARSITLVTGYTSITGGYLTGQVIQDARQRLIIDLPNATITAREGATIRGKVEIQSIDGEYKDAETFIDEKAAASGSAAAQEKIDNLQIGTTNILTGSYTAEGWSGYSTHEKSEYSLSDSTQIENAFIYSDYMNIGGNKDIVLSFEAKCTDNIIHCDFHIIPDNFNMYGELGVRYEKTTDWKRFVFKYKTPADWGSGNSIIPVRLRIDFNGTTDGQRGTVWIRNAQIEYGNIASFYSIPEADREYIAARQAQEKIDGIQIGGVNILNGSATGKGWKYWESHSGTEFSKQSSLGGEVSGFSDYIKIPGGTDIVVSFYAKNSGNAKLPLEFFILTDDYGDSGLLHSNYEPSTEWTYHSFKFKTPDAWGSGDSILPVMFRLDNNGSTDDQISTVYIKDVQIEYGNKVTSYSVPEADREYMAKEEAARQAQEKIDGVQIGGENIVSGTGTFTGETRPNYGGFGDLQSNTFRGNVVYQTTKDWQGFYFEKEPTTEPTIISFYARKISGNPIASTFVNKDRLEDYYFNIINEKWKQHYIFLESGANLKDSTGHGIIEFAGGIVQYSSPKVELGTKPTAWSPSEQDRKEQAENIANDKINNIQIGDTNLLDGSNKGWKNSSYLMATIPLGDYKPKEGEECTIVMKGKLGSGKEWLEIFNSGGMMFMAHVSPVEFNAEGVAIKTFNWRIGNDGNTDIWIYARPYEVTTESEIEWVKLVSGNKTSLLWSPSQNDQKANINAGRLFIRGTGHYRPADRMLIMNNDGVNRNEIQTQGLTLTIISRETFEILECITYDTTSTSGQMAFINKVKRLTDSVIVAITSCVSVTIGFSYPEFENALAQCGGSGILPEMGVPYALIGIPGIGKGNGLEVRTTAKPDAPYAEISVQVINGVPQGMGSAAAILAQQAILKATELEFINKAFSGSDLDMGNGIIMSGALLVENAPGSKVASAGLAGYVPSGLPNNETDYPMIFAGAKGALKANKAAFRVYADGRTYIESGIIGGFQIDGTSLTNAGFDNDATIVFRNDKLNQFAALGGYTDTVLSSIRPMCRLENHRNDDVFENYALTVSAKNGRTNHAIYIKNGFISGFAINATWTSSNYQIDKECYITIYNSHSHPTITLPPEPTIGRTIFIKLMDTEWINIAASGGKKLNANGRPVSNANNWMRSWCTAMLVWDGQYWVYNLIGL